MNALIEIEDMSKIYNPGENEVRALDNVSLRIDTGEFVAIVGQSGSGKSTLMNMIGCLDIPTKGKYNLAGKEVEKLKDDDLSVIRNQEIGFIFQGFNLIANLDAIGNVELPLIYRGIGKKQRRILAVESLEKVGLKERMKHRPAELSGGQQQRVAVARAIAAKPSIILADEPTGNLDSSSTEEVIQILRQLHKEGSTIIMITHAKELAEIADRMVVLKDGKIVEDTSVKDSEAE